MIGQLFHWPKNQADPALLSSSLYSEKEFYQAFLKDLSKCHQEVIIESPFITIKRMQDLFPVFRRLKKRGLRIVINTKPFDEHEPYYQVQAEQAVDVLQELGVLVLMTTGHHRKLAVLDKLITWEGSLNIFSQNDSCEIMRRIYSEQLADQMLRFLNLEKFTAQNLNGSVVDNV